MKTAIVLDSSCYITKEFQQKNDIKIVPLTINFENVSYREGVEDEKTTKEIFEKIAATKSIPSTSQPALSEWEAVFEKCSVQSYDRVVVFTISANLSGTFQGCTIAKNTFNETNDLKIDIFDTLNVAHASVVALFDIIPKIIEQPEYSNENIEAILNYYTENVSTLLVVDSLDFLAYGGRINSSIAAIGNLFGIKPLLRIKSGVFLEQAKCRSKKKAYQEVVKLFKEDVAANPGEYILFSAHALNEKECIKLNKVIADSVEQKVTVLPPLALGPVVANHVGPNSVGAMWCKKR